jgi:DNA-binding NarL/FixJ family response regulator
MTNREAMAIVHAILRDHMIAESRLFSDEKTKHVFAVRMAVIRALKARGLSDADIGVLLKRDRSTISYHARRLKS